MVDLGDVNLSSERTGSASSVSGGVSVIRFENLTVGSNVFHTVCLPSTSASIALGVAINEFLFSKGNELVVLNEVVTLNRAGSRESPA